MTFRIYRFEHERARLKKKPVLGHVEYARQLKLRQEQYERAHATDVTIKEVSMTTKVSIKKLVEQALRPTKGMISFALSEGKTMSGIVQSRKLKAKWSLRRDEDGETVLFKLNGVHACAVNTVQDMYDAARALFEQEKAGEAPAALKLEGKLAIFHKKLAEAQSSTVASLTSEIVMPTRLEGTIQFLGGQVFDWWAVERDNKIWLCSDGRDEAERVKDIVSFYGLLQADSEALASRKPRVLLVWELIPETTEMYLIPADDPILATARAAQGQYINHADLPPDAAVYELNDWLDSDEAKAFKAETPIKARIKEVIQAGFLC